MMKMNDIMCPNCGQFNPPDYIFCIGCGTKIAADVSFDTGFASSTAAAADSSATKKFGELKCPSCGAELEPDSIFCDNCGIRLVIDTPASIPDTAIDAASSDAVAAPSGGLKINVKRSEGGGTPNQNSNFKPLTGFDK